MTEFWLIRHGESESNAGLSTGPTADIRLTPRGQAQAQALAAMPIARAPDLIVTSGYRRAVETAAPLRARFPQARSDEWPIHEVVTLSDEHRANTTPAQRRPLVDAYWERCDPEFSDGAGAESFVQVIARAEAFRNRLRTIESDVAFIVGHGLFTRTLLWLHFANPTILNSRQMQAYRDFIASFHIPNTSVVKVYRNSAHELLFGAPSVAHIPPELRPGNAAPTRRTQED